MDTLTKAAQSFLAQQRIAVVGVSSSGQGAACAIYTRLRNTGHETFAVNVKGGEFNGAPLYPDLRSLPAPPEGVVIVTPRGAAVDVIEESAALGVRSVWLHQGMGGKLSSSSPEAVECCRTCGLDVISGACPMMYCEPVDFFHKCARFFMRITGKLKPAESGVR